MDRCRRKLTKLTILQKIDYIFTILHSMHSRSFGVHMFDFRILNVCIINNNYMYYYNYCNS